MQSISMNSPLQNCLLVNRTHDLCYYCWYFCSHPPSKHIPKLPFEMAPIDTPSVPRTMTKLNLSPPIVPLLVLWLSQIFQMEIVFVVLQHVAALELDSGGKHNFSTFERQRKDLFIP